MTSLASLQHALDSFREVWGSGYLACDLGTKLTCSEVEALAALLKELGDVGSAECWIRDHSFGDDCGDVHCRCVECFPHVHCFEVSPHYCDVCGVESGGLVGVREVGGGG